MINEQGRDGTTNEQLDPEVVVTVEPVSPVAASPYQGGPVKQTPEGGILYESPLTGAYVPKWQYQQDKAIVDYNTKQFNGTATQADWERTQATIKTLQPRPETIPGYQPDTPAQLPTTTNPPNALADALLKYWWVGAGLGVVLVARRNHSDHD